MAMVLAVACGGDDSPVGEKWGSTKCYEDFMWHKYEPQLMERELEIELFNIDAVKLFENKGSMTFYVSADKNKYVAPEGIDVYVNGEKCDNHRIVADFSNVRSEDTDTYTLSLNVGLMFTEVKDVEDYTLYFGYYTDDKWVSYNKSVRVDGVDRDVVLAEDLQVDLGELESVGIVVEQKVIMNPLKEKLIWGSIIVAGLFLLSIIISRMMTPKIKVSYIALTGNYQQRVRVKGKRSVVFTNTRKKQGFWSKLYKGTILYNVHPSWVSDVTFEPRGDKLVMRFNSDNYACDNFLLQRNQHYTLSDLTNRTKIDINVL